MLNRIFISIIMYTALNPLLKSFVFIHFGTVVKRENIIHCQLSSQKGNIIIGILFYSFIHFVILLLFFSCERQRHNQPGFEKEMFEAINTVRSACEAENVNMAGASLSWLLNQPATRSLIVGVSGPDQVERNTRLPKLSAVSFVVLQVFLCTGVSKCSIAAPAFCWCLEHLHQVKFI